MGPVFWGHADQAGAGNPKIGPQITVISKNGEIKEHCSTRELFNLLAQSLDSKSAMDLIMTYTIAVSVALLLFYPVVNCMRYITWRLTQRYPRLHHVLHYFFNSLLPSAFNFLPLLLLSLVPGTALFVRNVQYPLILPRRYWMSITRLECVMLALYFAANGSILILERANIGPMAAMLAVINAAPLFLGGRTNPLADFIGVPLSTYYIFHHFIGRVVVIEGMIHATLAFRRSRLDQTTTSGYIVSRPPAFFFKTKTDKTRLSGASLSFY